MSSVRVQLAPVAADRVITNFQQPFRPEGTPYQKANFHPKVKAACQADRTGRVGLKLTKAVLVGDVSVGKTCLVNRPSTCIKVNGMSFDLLTSKCNRTVSELCREEKKTIRHKFCRDVFDRDYKATIGVDFEVEKFSVLSIPITLQIWDTAGQERFKCIAASYYRGAQIVIVAFDLTDLESLHHTVEWMDSACENCQDPIKFLLGTKKDLLSAAAYQDVEVKALKFAKKIGAEYWASSSKSGENVPEFFFRAMCLSFDMQLLRELESGPMSMRAIGNDLIQVQRSDMDLYDRKKSRKCCT